MQLINEKARRMDIDGKQTPVIRSASPHFTKPVKAKIQGDPDKYRQMGMKYQAQKAGRYYTKPSAPRVQ